MKKRLSSMCAFLLAAALLVSMTACGSTNNNNSNESNASAEATEMHKIGVIVYDVNDNEVQMFRQYFERYIAESFPVEFVYSASVSNWEDESAFIESAIAEGVQGFISFTATNLPEAVKLCEASKVYYMIGSGNYSDDLLNQVKDNEWYLGCIGTDDKADYQAGADMAASYIANTETDTNIVVTTGGAAAGNYMHEMRARGVLEKLAELKGYTYDKSVDELVQATEVAVIGTGVDGVTVCICPGYDVEDKLKNALGQYDADAILSVLGNDNLVALATEAEDATGHDVWVGVVDCFSLWNRDLFHKTDSFGNSSLNYVTGKYASIIGPAFAAMYQAVCADASLYRVNGEAFHLNQGFWTADSVEKYDELYGYTESFAKNAYSSENLMGVMSAYTADASFEDFKALTEAADVESALARMNQ